MNKDKILKEIGDRIKKRREDISMKQSELAETIGYSSHSSIAKIESGLVDLPQSKIKTIAEALRTTPSYIMGWSDNITVNNVFPITTRKIPMLGRIACGEPIMASEEQEHYVEVGTELKADFCVKAQGNSMINARIMDGDIVFIRKQDTVSNGEIAAVLIDNDVTLKRVFYYPNTNKIVLQAENSTYEPLVYLNGELDQIKILGKAVAFQSDVR